MVPSFTYVATVEVIALLGLRPVFVEVCPKSFNLDVDDLKAKITKNSVAIVPVHLYGQCARMEEIMTIAVENELKVFEDTAQAIGAINYTYSSGRVKRPKEPWAMLGRHPFSLQGIGPYGDGGAIMTNDDELESDSNDSEPWSI